MATYKTKGIVIKRQNFGEADRLLTVFSEDKGKLKMIAKGARRTLSKLGSHLEPYYLIDIVAAEGKSFHTITSVRVEDHFLGFRNKLKVTARVYCAGEMIDMLTHDEEENIGVFHLLKDYLEYVEENPHDHRADWYFRINILNHLGYRPELFECAKCRGEVCHDGICWDSSHGGIVCDTCGKYSGKVSSETIKMLRLISKSEIGILKRVNMNTRLEKELEWVLEDFGRYLMQKDLVSQKFLRNLRGVLDVELAGG